MAELLSGECLRALFDYDPESGALTWKTRPREDFTDLRAWRTWLAQHEGKSAGGRHKGYLRLNFMHGGVRRQIAAHRAIWALVYGHWPVHDLDHRNGDRSDNRLSNLREATRAENVQNLRPTPTLGCWFDARTGRFAAAISVNRGKVWLGRFATREEARASYLAAKAKFHPFQPIPREAPNG